MLRTSQDHSRFKKSKNSGIIFYVLSAPGDQLIHGSAKYRKIKPFKRDRIALFLSFKEGGFSLLLVGIIFYVFYCPKFILNVTLVIQRI